MGQTYCAEKKVKIMKNRYEKPPANPHEEYFFSFCKKFGILEISFKIYTQIWKHIFLIFYTFFKKRVLFIIYGISLLFL